MNKELSDRYFAAKRRLFDRYLEAELNPRQREAVCSVNGPLLILAGAGSGKTTVLVRRIVFLIKYGNAYYSDYVPDGMDEASIAAMERAANMPREDIEYILPEFIASPCPPWQVLAITFTNKAAKEIRDRLAAAFDNDSMAEDIWAGTFHSICVRILRRFGSRLGFESNFSIYDTDEKKRLVTECMKRLNIDDKMLPVKTVMNEISRAKDALKSPSDLEQNDLRQRHIARIYEAYDKRLAASNALDFDDIIMKTVQLLECEPEVLSHYQRQFRYVLVDEYQDTNYAQFRLTELLSGGYRNIMVVGDDDQSIYRFRGATIENILNFDKTYPDAKIIKLEQNYRSTKTILDAANAVIAHNTMRHEKSLWSAKGEGEKIVLHHAATQEREASFITEKIMELVVLGKRRYSDFAVLYRVNEIARTLESAFAKSGMPYRVLGGQRFYDRKEVRDIIAYLVMIENGRDDQKLKRVINEPKRKIGLATVDAVAEIAEAKGVPMFEVLLSCDEYVALAKSAPRLKEFAELILSLRNHAGKVSELVARVLEETGYLRMLEAEGEEGITRIDSVNELVSAAVEYEKRVGEGATLSGFLEEVALVSDVDKYDEHADAVVLMTVHSAKGLEFPVVFLAGMEEGIFPGTRSFEDPDEIGEERRLAYVAITRAKERLFLSRAKSRLLYGRTQNNPLSRFVARELPPLLLAEEEDEAPYFGAPRPMYEKQGYAAERAARPRAESRPQRGISEFFSRASVASGSSPAGARRASASAFTRFSQGDRVHHATFGDGTVLTARDMGGDVLYEVAFDSGDKKKLMATFARMTKL
ncbi:MAG: UvrD-helicase domain-containing protein [Clostridia bacterium]|nr:UvrD-helicase domain-containing protein [Clostridia bacterium]